MKSTLKIVAIVSALVSVAATVILAYLYLEDASKYLKKTRRKIMGRISDRLMNQTDLEEEIYEF